MKSSTSCYPELRAFIETIRIIDCHDHSGEERPHYQDAMAAICSGYFQHDIESVSSEGDLDIISDESRSLDERWLTFERAWNRTKHTGYAQVTRMVMKEFYGESEMSLKALHRIQDKLLDLRDDKVTESILDKAGIAVRIVDCWADVNKIFQGTFQLPPRARLAISLPAFHAITSFDEVQFLVFPLGIKVTSLDSYLEACREIFAKQKQFGAVCFKDQSAYTRPIHFGNPSKSQAEQVFNEIMQDPRRKLSYPTENQPLGDYLFHQFIRMAKEMDLPVQLHTGHMAGVWNDVNKARASQLVSLLEIHRDVRFDLFHLNWPYAGDILFLGKNYPNVALDFCWTHIIDPVYCQRIIPQILSAVPHGKIHGYGSDHGGNVDMSWAHSQIARDNIAIGLAEMVEMDYIRLGDAKEIAQLWLFDNPNNFFRLGL